MAVGGGWRRLVVGPWGLSLTKKIWVLKDSTPPITQCPSHRLVDSYSHMHVGHIWGFLRAMDTHSALVRKTVWASWALVVWEQLDGRDLHPRWMSLGLGRAHGCCPYSPMLLASEEVVRYCPNHMGKGAPGVGCGSDQRSSWGLTGVGRLVTDA